MLTRRCSASVSTWRPVAPFDDCEEALAFAKIFRNASVLNIVYWRNFPRVVVMVKMKTKAGMQSQGRSTGEGGLKIMASRDTLLYIFFLILSRSLSLSLSFILSFLHHALLLSPVLLHKFSRATSSECSTINCISAPFFKHIFFAPAPCCILEICVFKHVPYDDVIFSQNFIAFALWMMEMIDILLGAYSNATGIYVAQYEKRTTVRCVMLNLNFIVPHFLLAFFAPPPPSLPPPCFFHPIHLVHILLDECSYVAVCFVRSLAARIKVLDCTMLGIDTNAGPVAEITVH